MFIKVVLRQDTVNQPFEKRPLLPLCETLPRYKFRIQEGLIRDKFGLRIGKDILAVSRSVVRLERLNAHPPHLLDKVLILFRIRDFRRLVSDHALRVSAHIKQVSDLSLLSVFMGSNFFTT